MSKPLRLLIVALVVLVGPVALGSAWFVYAWSAMDFGYTDHHSDAAKLERDLESLSGVIRAEADYSETWLEPNSVHDATLGTTVVLESSAPSDSLASAIARTNEVLQKHRDWSGTLTVTIGADSLFAYALRGDARPAGQQAVARLFAAIRTLGGIVATVDSTGKVLEFELELPVGSTADDLRPTYARLEALATKEAGRASLGVIDVTAADGTGFRTDGGAPSAAEWREWRRLSAIALPGADVGIRLRGIGGTDLLISTRTVTADLENPEFRGRLTEVVRGEISEFRTRIGHAPTIAVWIDGRPVAYVGPDRCRYGLSSWDDELNEWFWEVDCSKVAGFPTDPKELEQR